MKNVLFVPFSSKEGNLSLYLRALTWRYNLKNNHKISKVPDVIVYRRVDELDEDYDEYDAALFKFSPSILSPESNIYIIADGMGDKHFVSNTNSPNDDLYIMPIELVALRIKQAGLTSDLAKNLKSVKLFICDHSSQNQFLANNFAKTMGEDYNDLNIDYYTTPISLPCEIPNPENLNGSFKCFVSDNTSENTSNQIKKNSIKFGVADNGTITHLESNGAAHENKKRVNVGECIKSKLTSFPKQDIIGFLETNEAKHLNQKQFGSYSIIRDIKEIEVVEQTDESEITLPSKVSTPDDDSDDGKSLTASSNDSRIDGVDDSMPISKTQGKSEETEKNARLEKAFNNLTIDVKSAQEQKNKALVVRKEMPIIKYNFFQPVFQQSQQLETHKNIFSKALPNWMK